MSETNDTPIFPKSPKVEVGGIPYFSRMCDKIRLQLSGDLHTDYQSNMGRGFDRWTCDYLRVEYSDAAALEWAVSEGGERTAAERDWWLSYMRNRCYKDNLSELLEKRKSENGLADRDDIMCMFDLIDADEGRN
jgi:hypothetical protein